MLSGDRLRDALREIRDGMTDDHATRLHRAVSWLRCAEQYSDTDDDIAFIALWVSFNSLYAIDDNRTDHTFRDDFDTFIGKLITLDEEERVYNSLWMNFSGFVRVLIDNRYVYGPFWLAQHDDTIDWESSFKRSQKQAMRALADSDVPALLRTVIERLYVLRNQVVHGGATWQSQVNRDQIRDGKRLLLELIPVFIELMFNDSSDWGPIYYPVA